MKLGGTIEFWGTEVGCFCHEAIARALHSAFDDISIDVLDVAYEKYTNAAGNPTLERSAWFEFLRSGPRHSFSLSSGVIGWFSRYRIEFEIPADVDNDVVSRIRQFLQKLSLGSVRVVESA